MPIATGTVSGSVRLRAGVPVRPLRSLVTGPEPSPDRIFHHNIWFRGHNNGRLAALLPRLSRVDHYLITCSDRRIPRGLQFRALWYGGPVRNRLVVAAANRRYRSLFTSDPGQIPLFRGKSVFDADDPRFSEEEVRLMSSPGLAAFVVTAERAGRRYQELGVRAPYVVIPQGIDLAAHDPARDDAVRAERRRPGDVVVGYMASWLLCEGDPHGEKALYNVDHLLDLWDEIQERVPQARLWLLGNASDRLRAKCRERPGIELLGWLPLGEALSHVANLDLALYPRTADEGIAATKVAEYMGLGVPTVSYDHEVTEMLRRTGAGLMARTPREFVDAVVRLAADEGERARVAAAAGRAGAELDWDHLARRYEREVLDVHLP